VENSFGALDRVLLDKIKDVLLFCASLSTPFYLYYQFIQLNDKIDCRSLYKRLSHGQDRFDCITSILLGLIVLFNFIDKKIIEKEHREESFFSFLCLEILSDKDKSFHCKT
jgi:low temperature requirement protein LtrA